MSSSAKCPGCQRAAGHQLGCRYRQMGTPQTAEAARRAAFVEAIEECQVYSKGATSEEARAVAMHIAVRITQRGKRRT